MFLSSLLQETLFRLFRRTNLVKQLEDMAGYGRNLSMTADKQEEILEKDEKVT